VVAVVSSSAANTGIIKGVSENMPSLTRTQTFRTHQTKAAEKNHGSYFPGEDSKRGPHKHKAGILTSTTEYSSRVNEFSKNPRNPQNSKRRNGDAK